jgi:phage head maturation protease
MATVSDAPWDGDAGRFTLEQWKRSCLINHGGDGSTKGQYSLPVREPDGTLNKNGLSAAAGRLNQVQGITAEARATAARKLISLYHEIGMDPPDHLRELAGAAEHDATPRAAPPPGANAAFNSGSLATSQRPTDETPRSVRVPVERRVNPIAVELRALATQDNSRRATIGGYAAVFGRESRLIPGHSGHGPFVERVAPTFFDAEYRSGWPGLQGVGVVARYNHSNDFLLGTTQAGTLRLAIDGIGLDYSVDLPESRSDTLELVTRGDVNASSFTFIVADYDGDEWAYSGGVTQRTLISGTLIDVAPVGGALAAYPDATVALRSLAAHKGATEDEVRALVEQGDVRKLFTRTDIDGYPRGDTMNSSRPTMDWTTAHLALMLTRIPPTTEAELRHQQRELAELRSMRT